MTAPSSAWELVATHQGGTVNGLATATAPDGSIHVYAATPVGVFWSGDGGAHWQPLEAASAVAGAEVVAPSPDYPRDGTVFIGGHGGLFRWQASGRTLDHLLSGSRVLALAVLPAADTAAADERGPSPVNHRTTGLTLLAGTEDDGILISRDAGLTWEGANPGLLDLTVLALAASPDFHHDGLAFAATPSGLYRTRNGAASWRTLELDDDDVAVQCLAISPDFADDRLLLAGTEAHGLLRSDDGGRTWDAVPDLAERSVNAVTFVLEGEPGAAAGPVLAATDAGIVLSDDGGASWRRAGDTPGRDAPAHEGALCVAAVPATSAPLQPPDAAPGSARPADRTPPPRVLLAGLPDRGIARSLDGGQTWAAANDGLHASLLVGLACSPGFARDQTLYAASLERGVSVSRDGGRTWTDANDGLGSLAVSQVTAAPSPDGTMALFAATASGLCVSRDGAASWQPALPDDDGGGSVVVAAQQGSVLAATAGGLVLSTDAGSTWARLATPFGDARIVALALSPTVDRDCIHYAAVAGVSRSDGTADLTVWCYGRPGARWKRLLDERATPAVQLAVVADGSTGGTVLVGLGTRLLRPRANAVEVRGGVRRPVWDAAVLPGTLAGLAVSPPGAPTPAVFAATGSGVFRSHDGGATFAAWGNGLGQPGTVAVAASPNYDHDRLVFAVRLGGTIWRRQSE
jgi:hypothetical protein